MSIKDESRNHHQFFDYKSKSCPSLPVSLQLQTKLHFEEPFRDMLTDKDKALESLNYLDSSNIQEETSDETSFYDSNIVIISNRSESSYYDSSIKNIIKNCI